MTSMTMNRSLRDQVQMMMGLGYRHIFQVHTWDGVDRTWQSAGADDNPTNAHTQAQMALHTLMERVERADLPFQWLLDLSIIVETYDRETRTALTENWAVVFVPEHATSRLNLTYTNRYGLGFQVVHYSGHGVTLPKHAALDITTEA